MKRSILFFFLVCFSFGLYAKEVTVEQAKLVGLEWMRAKVKTFSGTVRNVETVYHKDVKSIYIVNFAPTGWVMISGDDTSTPLLAYSPNGSFSLQRALPDNVQGWLNVYSQEVERNAQLMDEPVVGWDPALIRTRVKTIGGEVKPIITIGWNQGDPYNQFCPKFASQRTLVGCVAVAMAQAMSVAQHPARPVGTHSYRPPSLGTVSIDYDKEKSYSWEQILTGTDNYKETARLLYHCGVAVNMQYGVEASGAYTSEVGEAMQQYFSYKHAKYYSRASYSGDWAQLIINELQAGRAVIYAGQDVKKRAGHAFNLDGYDGDRMYHVNWGWGNYGNGYYSIDALRDSYMDMDYTANQGMVIGIDAPSEKPRNILLSNNRIESGLLAGTPVGEVRVENAVDRHEYTFTVRGKYNLITQLYQEVPFEIKEGKLLATRSLDPVNREIEIVVEDKTNNTSLAQGFLILVTGTSSAQKTIEEATSFAFDKTTGFIAIQTKQNVSYTVVSEATGEEYYAGRVTTETRFDIDTEALASGVYILTLSDEKDTKKLRFVVKESVNALKN